MLVKTYGSAIVGVNALMVTVEVTVGDGLGFFMVGLPDNAVKESAQRIVSAFEESGYRIPGQRITVNLAPADLKKEGSAYDLTIAVATLGSLGYMKADDLDKYVIMGELGLDGTLRPIKGVLPIAIEARKQQYKGIIVPAENAREAAIVNNLEVYGANTLKEVIDFFNGEGSLEQTVVDTRAEFARSLNSYEYDFADVKGQATVKRCLEIAAAGGHNAIMIGPPGSGKTMLAKRMPGILPPLTLSESLETTQIHSVAGLMRKEDSLIAVRPFRAPHHTISDVALVGGGINPKPGEISLAHNGVLFLDELPEFKRTVLEVLRQPMEERRVTISRAKMTIDYPASFMLIAAMNPCPCGYYNHPTIPCTCPPGSVKRYLNKVSGHPHRSDARAGEPAQPRGESREQRRHPRACRCRSRHTDSPLRRQPRHTLQRPDGQQTHAPVLRPHRRVPHHHGAGHESHGAQRPRLRPHPACRPYHRRP